MTQTIVTVKLNGQPYQMQCAEDEVAQIEQLASEVDTMMQQLRPQGGHIPDIRLLAIISIMMAARAKEAETALSHAQNALSEQSTETDPPAAQEPVIDVKDVSAQIENVALRINAITAKLAQQT